MDILRPTTKCLETPSNSLATATMAGFQSSPATPRKRTRILTMNPIAITELLIPTLDHDHEEDMNEEDDRSASSRPANGNSHRRSFSYTRMYLKPRPHQHGSGASSAALFFTTGYIFEPEQDKKQEQHDRSCRSSSRGSAPSHPHSSPVTKSYTGTTTQICLQHPQEKKAKFLGRPPQPRPAMPDPLSSIQNKLEYARCA
jgi:hypothetical protein